jgi:hypothetical protein
MIGRGRFWDVGSVRKGIQKPVLETRTMEIVSEFGLSNVRELSRILYG